MGRKPLSQAQREQRGRDIRDAARKLYETQAYEAIKVAGIAREAGVAKGTVFLYYPSKEALFAALAADLLGSWFSEFGGRIEAAIDGGIHADVERFLDEMNSSFSDFHWLPRLMLDIDCRLSPGEAGHQEYRERCLEIMDAGGELLESYFPYLEAGTGPRIFSRFLALLPAVAGFGGHWQSYVIMAESNSEDPAIRRSGGSPARDFYIHSVRRILKGFSLQ
jgi:AcrR family transcriptional regulator